MSRFWCDRRLSVTVDGPSGSRTIIVPKPYARIGTVAGADVQLSMPDAEPRHLYLHATANGIFARGLFHTDPNEPQIRQWLQPEDRVEIGSHSISVKLVGEGGPTSELAQPVATAGKREGPYPILEIRGSSGKLGELVIRDKLVVVGRRFPSDLLAHKGDLSATHCAVFWGNDRLWIVDLLSTNGTWKNGRRIQAAYLTPGNGVEIGSLKLIFDRLSRFDKSEELENRPALEPSNAPLELSAFDLPDQAQTSLALEDLEAKEESDQLKREQHQSGANRPTVVHSREESLSTNGEAGDFLEQESERIEAADSSVDSEGEGHQSLVVQSPQDNETSVHDGPLNRQLSEHEHEVHHVAVVERNAIAAELKRQGERLEGLYIALQGNEQRQHERSQAFDHSQQRLEAELKAALSEQHAQLMNEVTSHKNQLAALEEVTQRGAEQTRTEWEAARELHDKALQSLRADMQRIETQIDHARTAAEGDAVAAELQPQGEHIEELKIALQDKQQLLDKRCQTIDQRQEQLEAELKAALAEQHGQLLHEVTSHKNQISALEELTKRGAEQSQTEWKATGERHGKALQDVGDQLQRVQAQLEQQSTESVERLESFREQLAAVEARIQQEEAKSSERQLDLERQQRQLAKDRQAWEELRDRECEHISQRAQWLEAQVTEMNAARQRLEDQLRTLNSELERAGELQAVLAYETSRGEQQQREWLTQRTRLEERLANHEAYLKRVDTIADSTQEWEPRRDGGSPDLLEPRSTQPSEEQAKVGVKLAAQALLATAKALVLRPISQEATQGDATDERQAVADRLAALKGPKNRFWLWRNE